MFASAASAQEISRATTAPQTSGLINFDNFDQGAPLSTQYQQSHGVTFGPGDSIQRCAQTFSSTAEINFSVCPYPQAASGSQAALHDVRTGGNAMVVNFARPVSYLSVRINPTGGSQDEAFVAQINGFDENGTRIATNSLRFNWFQDAFSWPTSVDLETNNGRVARATIELRRPSQNNQAVRFLIDDLQFQYAPDSYSPVIAGLAEQQGPPLTKEAVIVQSTRVGPAQSELQIYPAATRKRVFIDWDAVKLALDAQASVSMKAAPYKGERFVEMAELPLLLPSQADAGTVIVMGNKDTYNAHFRKDGLAYSVYGSRILTVIGKNDGAPGVTDSITFMATQEALTASFSLYGASYSLTRHCKDENVDEDPACHDREALGIVASELAVVVGAAGRERP